MAGHPFSDLPGREVGDVEQTDPESTGAHQGTPQTLPANGPVSDTAGQRLTIAEKKVLALAFSATFCIVSGLSSIVPSVPMAAEVFDIPIPATSLIITIFTLPGIVLCPLAGVLADRYGRKPILLLSFFFFVAGGLACSLAETFATLLCLRAVQGTGAAALGMLNTTIIADTFSGQRMTRYIGLNMTLLSIGTASLPLLGGMLAEAGWNWPYYLNAAVIPFVLYGAKVPLHKPRHHETLAVYFGKAVGLLASRRVASLFGITLGVFIVLYGPVLTVFPLAAHSWFKAPPSEIGGVMITSSLGTTLITLVLARLSARFSHRNLLLTGQTASFCAMLIFPFVGSLYWAAVPLFIFGLGQGLSIPVVQVQLLKTAEQGQRAVTMAINGTLLRLGQTIGPALFSTIAVNAGTVGGFRVGAAFVVGLLCFTAAAVSEKTAKQTTTKC